MLEFMGMLIRYYPQAIPDSSVDQLIKTALRVAESELFKSKKPDLPLVAGAIRALDHALHTVSDKFSPDAKPAAALYKLMIAAINPPETLVRYDVPRSTYFSFCFPLLQLY